MPLSRKQGPWEGVGQQRQSQPHLKHCRVLGTNLRSDSDQPRAPFPKGPRESHEFGSWGSFSLGHWEDSEPFMQHNLVKRIGNQNLNFQATVLCCVTSRKLLNLSESVSSSVKWGIRLTPKRLVRISDTVCKVPRTNSFIHSA